MDDPNPMALIVTFFSGVLATWVGLILTQRVTQRDKRSLVSARIHRSLDASARVVKSNPTLGPLIKTVEASSLFSGGKNQEPKEVYEAAIKEVEDFKQFIRHPENGPKQVTELKKQVSQASEHDRQRLEKVVAEYKAQYASGLGFPSDEDLTYLAARIAPYAFEYKQRLGKMLNSLELLSAPDFTSWPDERILDWVVEFLELLILLIFLERMLRDATARDVHNRFPWI